MLRRVNLPMEIAEIDTIVTFEVNGSEDIWAQVNVPTINLAYPHSVEPLVFLEIEGISIPSSIELYEWEPGRFVTFDIYDHGYEVCQFLDRLLIALHRLDAERYEISTSID